MSNCYVLSGGTLIQNNANLNDFFTPGNYYCPGSVAAQTLINCPCNNAFIMKVELGTGREYPTQTIVEFNTGRRFFRVFVIDTHSWRDWISYITNSDISVASSPHIEIRMEDSVQGRRLVITDPGQNKWYGNILMDTTGDDTLP